MKKLLLILSTLTITTAQSQEYEVSCEPGTHKVTGFYEKEVSDLRSGLMANNWSEDRSIILDNYVSEEGKHRLQEQFDYLPAPVFLRGQSPGNHKVEKYAYTGLSVFFDGSRYDNLNCTEIRDEYDITHPATGITYHYSNIYFHFQNEAAQDIGTLIYVKKSTGSLVSESHIVKTYSITPAGLIFDVFPNPIRDIANMEVDISQPGIYNFYISDLMGRKIISPIQDRFLSEGRHRVSYNVSHLSGQYYITVEGEGSRSTKKINVE